MRTVAYCCNWQENTLKGYEATFICPVWRMLAFWIWGGGTQFFKMYYYFIIYLFYFFSSSSEILRPTEFCARCYCTGGTAHASPLGVWACVDVWNWWKACTCPVEIIPNTGMGVSQPSPNPKTSHFVWPTAIRHPVPNTECMHLCYPYTKRAIRIQSRMSYTHQFSFCKPQYQLETQ